MKISVIIVSYNVRCYLEQCLLSVRKSLQGIESEVLVVDNHSRDGSVEYLRRRFREVKFIASNHNLGFARGNNLAIKRAKGEYLLLLNPDTVVGENVLRESLNFMDGHPEAGGLGVKMLKCNGEKAMESRRGLPSPLIALYKMCGLCNKFPNSRRFGKYYMSYLPWDKPQRIEVISGAFFLLRHKAIDDIGMLDEDFFMYGEDIDLSYRLLKAGYQNWYIPSSILHYKGESTQKSSFRYVHVFYEAMLIFFRKHYRHLSFCISLPIKSAIYMKAGCALIKMTVARIVQLLGFVPYRHRREIEYLFMCSKENIRECRRISENKGLAAKYVESESYGTKLWHFDAVEQINPLALTYVVYDSSLFRYEEILRAFEENPQKNVLMGIYNPHNHSIITDQEIIK